MSRLASTKLQQVRLYYFTDKRIHIFEAPNANEDFARLSAMHSTYVPMLVQHLVHYNCRLSELLQGLEISYHVSFRGLKWQLALFVVPGH